MSKSQNTPDKSPHSRKWLRVSWRLMVRSPLAAALFVALIIGWLYYARSSSAVLQPIAVVGSSQLSRLLGVPCEVGDLEGDPLKGMTVGKVVVGKGSHSPIGSLIDVRDIRVAYRLGAMLRRTPPTEAIDSVEIGALKVYVHRSADGKWNLAELAPKKKPGPRKKPPRFLGKVRLRNVEVHFRDDTVPKSRGGSFTCVALFPEIKADFGRYPRVTYALAGNCEDDLLRALEVDGEANLDSLAVQAAFKVLGVDAPTWARLAPLPQGLRLDRAEVSVIGGIELVPGEKQRQLKYHCGTELVNFRIQPPGLKTPVAGKQLQIASTGTVTTREVDSRKRPAAGPEDPTQVTNAGKDTTVAGQVTLTGNLEQVGDLTVGAEFDTNKRVVSGTAGFTRVAIRHWLEATGVNQGVRLSSGTAGVNTEFRLAFPGGGPTTLDLDGSARLSQVGLSPRVLKRPLRNLHTNIDYSTQLTFADTGVRVSGNADVAGGSPDFPRFNVRCNFDSAGPVVDSHVRLAGLQVRTIPQLIGGVPAFTPEAGVLSVDVDVDVDRQAVTYLGRVDVQGFGATVEVLPEPMRDLTFNLDFRGAVPLRGAETFCATVASRQPLPRLGDLEAEVACLPAGGVEIRGSASEVDIGYWGAVAVPRNKVQVLGGRADARFHIATAPRLQYEVRGEFAEVSARVPGLAQPVTGAGGRYAVSPDEVKLVDTAAALADSTFEATGTMTDFAAPQLSLAVTADRLNLEELLKLAPEPDKLPRLTAPQPGAGEFAVSGPVTALALSGTVSVPPLTVADADYGSFQVAATPVTVSLENLTGEAPVMELRAEGLSVHLDQLNRELLGPTGEAFGFPRPATVALAVTGTTKAPEVSVSATLPALTIGEERLTDVQAQVRYAGKQLLIRQAAAKSRGGALTAAGSMTKTDEAQRLDLRGKVSTLALQLVQPWLQETGLTVRGRVTGDYQLSGPVDDLQVAGELAVTKLAVTQPVSPDSEASRRFEVGKGTAKLALALTRGEEKSQVSGQVMANATEIDVRLPAPEPDDEAETKPETVVHVDDVGATLHLTPTDLTAERIEARAYDGQAVLTDFRYDLERKTLTAQADVRDLALAALGPLTGREDLGGTARFTGALRVSPEGPSLKGPLRIEALRVGESPECQVTADVDVAFPEVRLASAGLRGLGCRIEADGTARLPEPDNDAGALDLHVTGGGALTQVVETYVPESVQLSGVVSLEASLGGTFKTPEVKAAAEVKSGKVRGLPIDRLEVRATLTGETGKLESLRAEVAGATLSASGELQPERQLSVDFNADPIPVSALLKLAQLKGPAQGVLRVQGRVTGALGDPLVKCRLSSDGLRLGKESLGSLTGDLSYREQRVNLAPVTWEFNGGGLSAAGWLPVSKPATEAPAEPQHQADCKVTWEHLTFGELRRVAEELAAFLSVSERPAAALDNALLYLRKLRHPPQLSLGGEATVAGTLREPDVPGFHLAVTDGSVGGEPLPTVALNASYHDGVVKCQSLSASLEDMEAELSGTADLEGEASMLLEVHNFPLALANPWAPTAPEVSGLADLTALVTGPTKAPRVEGSIEIVEPAFRQAVLDRVRLTHFILDQGAFTVDPEDLLIMKGEHQITAGCRLPVSYKGDPLPGDKPFEAQLRLLHGDFSLLRELFPTAPRVYGQVDAELAAAGTLDQPSFTGKLVIDNTNFELPGMDSNLHGLHGELRLESGRRLVLDNLTAMLSTAPADTTLLPMFRQDTLRLSGSVTLTDEGLRHPLENLFDVLLEMDELELKLSDTSPLTGIDSEISLKTRPEDGREVIKLEQLTARGDGDSGPFIGSGQVVLAADALKSLDEFNTSEVAVDFSTQGLRLTRAPYGSVTFDTDLHFVNDPLRDNRPVLRGDVLVHDTRVKPPKKQPAPDTPTPLPQFPEIDLFVTMGEDVQVVHPALQAQLTGGLQISGTPADILVSGNLASEKGVVKLPRAQAQLQRADVDVFVQNDPVTKQLTSRVWIQAYATAEADDYQVEINIRGPLLLQEEEGENELELRLTSTPSLPQEQIYALLIGSLPTGNGGGMSFQPSELRDKFQHAVVGLFAAQASSVLTKELREALGLDKLEVVWDDEGLQEVSLAKRFGKITLGVRKVLGQSTGTADTAFQAEYRFSKKFAAEFEQDEFEVKNLNLKFRFNFDT